MSDFVTIKIIPTDEETLSRYERRCEFNLMVQEFARRHKEVDAIQIMHDPHDEDCASTFDPARKLTKP